MPGRQAGVLCVTDGWLAGSGDWGYPVALLLSKLYTQITRNSVNRAVQNRMKSNAWHGGGASHEKRQTDSGASLSWAAAHSVSSSVSCSHAHSLSWPLSLSPSLCISFFETIAVIPRILLQGLISFPFLERLFKYCYIHSQQQFPLFFPEQQQQQFWLKEKLCLVSFFLSLLSPQPWRLSCDPFLGFLCYLCDGCGILLAVKQLPFRDDKDILDPWSPVWLLVFVSLFFLFSVHFVLHTDHIACRVFKIPLMLVTVCATTERV